MKINYISYQEIDGSLKYYKHGSYRVEISHDEYDSLKSKFKIAHRLNKPLIGSYYPVGILCGCDQPRNMGYLDSMLDDQCGLCGRSIY